MIKIIDRKTFKHNKKSYMVLTYHVNNEYEKGTIQRIFPAKGNKHLTKDVSNFYYENEFFTKEKAKEKSQISITQIKTRRWILKGGRFDSAPFKTPVESNKKQNAEKKELEKICDQIVNNL